MDPAAGAPRAASRLAVQVGVLVTAAVVVLDQATKELAEALLELGEFVPFLGERIGWQLVYNPGAAFGIPAPAWLFLIVTVLVTWIVARALPRTTSLLQAAAYGLLLAGALGNAIDRLVRPNVVGEVSGFFQGDVVDFVAWGTFPRFNVADSAITVGFVLLTLALWREERSARGDEAVDTAPGVDDADAAVERDSPGSSGVADGRPQRAGAPETP
ncbi:signal peptidase II [Egicoccus sp. AB-alg2]|uniref:signal peptidase II n=1 Tax=Egicoccus sp. AB-alg2 TaxID=3242693 RepID=UPI00359D4CEC